MHKHDFPKLISYSELYILLLKDSNLFNNDFWIIVKFIGKLYSLYTSFIFVSIIKSYWDKIEILFVLISFFKFCIPINDSK